MAHITSSIDLLYSLKPWCCWIIFIKKNLILLVCPFCFNIQINNCLQVREIFNFTGCSRNSKKLCSSAPIEHIDRDIGTAKWPPYNV